MQLKSSTLVLVSLWLGEFHFFSQMSFDHILNLNRLGGTTLLVEIYVFPSHWQDLFLECPRFSMLTLAIRNCIVNEWWILLKQSEAIIFRACFDVNHMGYVALFMDHTFHRCSLSSSMLIVAYFLLAKPTPQDLLDFVLHFDCCHSHFFEKLACILAFNASYARNPFYVLLISAFRLHNSWDAYQLFPRIFVLD